MTIRSAKLPAGAGPVRIVHLSDLHCDSKVRLEGRLPQVVAALKPDLIVFTGDAANSADGLENFRRCMKELAALAPAYAVRGNWDGPATSNARLFGGTGVVELDGRAVTLDVRGARIRLGGAPVGWAAGLEAVLAAARPECFNVLLYHKPEPILRVADRGCVDLMLAGHTHGGQVALPFYGAVITLAAHGKRFEAGLYRVKDTWLYVSRGIGMEGSIVPRIRFLARPEVTLIEVVPEVRGG